MKNKLLFLDFDGVIVTLFFIEGNKLRFTFNQQAICWLNKLYDMVPYSIVITSTWKLNKDLVGLTCLLHENGLKEEIEILDVTPDLPREYCNKLQTHTRRGREIHNWLHDFKFFCNTEKYSLSDFLILDDDNDMWKYKKHLIQCTQAGFTVNEYRKCIERWTHEKF